MHAKIHGAMKSPRERKYNVIDRARIEDILKLKEALHISALQQGYRNRMPRHWLAKARSIDSCSCAQVVLFLRLLLMKAVVSAEMSLC